MWVYIIFHCNEFFEKRYSSVNKEYYKYCHGFLIDCPNGYFAKKEWSDDDWEDADDSEEADGIGSLDEINASLDQCKTACNEQIFCKAILYTGSRFEAACKLLSHRRPPPNMKYKEYVFCAKGKVQNSLCYFIHLIMDTYNMQMLILNIYSRK